MLACRLGGEARTEGELARAGGVTPQAATSQLAQLEHAGLICARRQGRHKYFTLADADVAHVLQAMALVAECDGVATRWQRPGYAALKHARRCYGHLAGDKVLKIIATELAKRLRKTDFIARFGGEEFVLLIPGTPLEGAQQLLETLRTAIESCPFHFKGERVTITLSAGVSAFAAGERAEQVFERADQALYRAKRSGRNRIDVG